MLTRDEAVQIAERARQYPKGHGYSYFIHKKVNKLSIAAAMILADKDNHLRG